jgi:hypothetical protein
MPIIIRTPLRRLSQAEFGDLAYAVMECVFQIHSELGRFFDEKIYKRELAHRYPGVQLEVPIEVKCYEEALTHFLGGEAHVLANVEVRTAEHPLGHQRMHLAAPCVAFAVTALREADPDFGSHARRLLCHTDLEAILWANISLKMVTFTTIS